MKRILIVAGDPSGDLIGSKLIRAMKRIQPDLHVTGVGGQHLERVSDRFLKNIVKQHALGFAISPQKIKFFCNLLSQTIIPEMKKNPPDAVIPVDFYGFNARLAKAAKRLGHRVFYYVSPQFWASRPGRADRLRRCVDLFLCLFPFEIEFYKKRNLPAQFVGHPVLDTIPMIPSEFEPRPRVESHIGLLPGSRPEEIRRHLPIMMEACYRISEQRPGLRLFLFTVPHVPKKLYHDILSRSPKTSCLVDLVQDEDYSWRSQLDLAITASGMETFENMLFGIPMVVMYKTSWINYVLARLVIRIRFLGMPNLLANKLLVPEFIQWEATPDKISRVILRWLKDPQEKKALRRQLLALRGQFGEGDASDRAARTILEKVA